MHTLTLKNIPDEVYNSLKHSAERHHRSLNGEAIYLLKQSTAMNEDPEEILKAIRSLRSTLPYIEMTDEELKKMKEEGRE